MERKHRLAELQLAIMQILWDREEATVAEVRDEVTRDRELAYTTVATMLTKMEASGYVAHRVHDRIKIFRPLIERDDVSRSMVTDLADRLFRGDLTQMMCSLLDGCDASPEELARLRKLIREREKEQRHD